ncbi:MAG: hypothetical protein ACD_73C00712G0001 [uncultured bacterium]|nr:MAG: hypothetical protein ACD_73C00712G0001 [uncultured bacterium]
MLNNIDFAHFTIFTLFLVYLSGVATSLTPCVYPLIPVVVGYLGNQSGSNKHRFFVCLSYVAGLSLIYSALGVVAVFTGSVFGEMTTSSWLYLAFGFFMALLGGTMMDFYEIPLPRFLAPKADPSGASHKSLFKSFMVGATSGLVASPCTAPVLAGLLLYIASQKQYGRGAFMMLIFSLGLNTLLLAIGFSAGILRNIPRSGMWMIRVKKIMGLILIGTGFYFVYRAGQIS